MMSLTAPGLYVYVNSDECMFLLPCVGVCGMCDTCSFSRTVYAPSGQGWCHGEPVGLSLVHIALVLKLSGCVYKTFHVSC